MEERSWIGGGIASPESRRSVVRAEPETYLCLLADADRQQLMTLGGVRRFARGEHLLHQGERGEQVLVLLDGHVKTSSIGADGRESVLSFRGPGDVLGELSFLRSGSRSTGAIAIEAVRARSLSSAEFRNFLEHRPRAALALIDLLARRFEDANRARAQFGGSDAVGRLSTRLVELCERYGLPGDEGVEIALPLTQADLGGWAASSRAGAAEALRTMRELGWIRTARRRITVLDLPALVRRSGVAASLAE